VEPTTPPAHEFRRIELSERDLREINGMLDWRAGTLLDCRLLGRVGVTPGKRTEPAPVPDPRIVALHRLIDLRGKSVLEVGCFEGIHTLGLRMFSEDVTAIDIRPVNVIKTVARLSYHGTWAKVFQADVETLETSFGVFDLIFHCGVLYHLMAPVEHLMAVGRMCRYLFLDTHVARDEKRIVTLEIDGYPYRGAFHDEGGWADPFSGKDRRSLWLTRESLDEALRRAGFANLKVLEEREERNGPRLSLLAVHPTAGLMEAE
jgi:2-polyprenyl-3-methyl-5-hydroxy-6-metoxy-1,4-benzoquinol methylase